MTLSHVRAGVDWAAVAVGITAWAGWIPAVAGLFSIVWIGMQIVLNWRRFVKEVKSFFNGGEN